MVFCTDVTERKRAAEAETLNAQNLLSSLEATVLAMASTIETRDPYTSGHQQRVTELAVAISKAMALSDNVIQGIRMAGIVHDIGKITVPAEILNKPGELNPIELSLIKMHSRRGYEMLQKIEFPWPIAKIVLQHHERLNGSGYPDHISGSDILPEARIIAVADVVEAMASHRPYRAALGIEAALEEISLNKVTLYDPAVVETCLKLFAAGFTFTTVA
jgi:putative nucleotidyltransferase with HDIG domain